MKKIIIYFLFAAVLFQSCGRNQEKFDASGSFEADEVIVSSQIGGQLLSFNVAEGSTLQSGAVVGLVDAKGIALQKQQVEAAIQSLAEKTSVVEPQVQLLRDQLTVQESQLANLMHERERFEKLVKADAATGKQLDDINAQIDVITKQMKVTHQQIDVQKSNTGTMNRGILSEAQPMQKQAEQLQDQISKSNIVNPLSGVVLTKYAEAGEFTTPGKALYKIANLDQMTLRAYITGVQLSQVKLNQPVEVLIDNGARQYRKYNGTIYWISDKAEFTPKTIQTKEERANLVYAVKVRVKNDGYLKIGMFGELKF